MGHVILLLKRLAENSCKASENVLCPAVILSFTGNQLHEILFALLFVCVSNYFCM